VTDLSAGHGTHDSGVCAAGEVMSALLELLLDATQRVVRGAGVVISASAPIRYASPKIASSQCDPNLRHLPRRPYNVDDLRPIFIFSVTELVPHVGKLLMSRVEGYCRVVRKL
jgi:hypothetical protein